MVRCLSALAYRIRGGLEKENIGEAFLLVETFIYGELKRNSLISTKVADSNSR